MEQTARISDSTRAGLWFALLGGAVAWLGHLIGAWLIAEFGCIAGLGEWFFLGITAVAWMVIVVSILTLAIALAATYAGWRLHVRFPDPQTDTGAARGDAPYLAGAGLITSGLFTLIILVETIPILFYLWRC